MGIRRVKGSPQAIAGVAARNRQEQEHGTLSPSELAGFTRLSSRLHSADPQRHIDGYSSDRCIVALAICDMIN